MGTIYLRMQCYLWMILHKDLFHQQTRWGADWPSKVLHICCNVNSYHLWLAHIPAIVEPRIFPTDVWEFHMPIIRPRLNRNKSCLRDEKETIEFWFSNDIKQRWLTTIRYFIYTKIFASNFAVWKSISDFTKKLLRPITNHGLRELCFRRLFCGNRG